MREYKFRAWDGKEMFDVLRYDFFMHIAYTIGNRAREHKELMQFTGLFDKEGKEIYEGDILTWDDPLINQYWDIEWKDMWDHATWHASHAKAIIAGNIYENPELLDG